jgi:hypothetical protein
MQFLHALAASDLVGSGATIRSVTGVQRSRHRQRIHKWREYHGAEIGDTGGPIALVGS